MIVSRPLPNVAGPTEKGLIEFIRVGIINQNGFLSIRLTLLTNEPSLPFFFSGLGLGLGFAVGVGEGVGVAEGVALAVAVGEGDGVTTTGTGAGPRSLNARYPPRKSAAMIAAVNSNTRETDLRRTGTSTRANVCRAGTGFSFV